MAGETVLLAGVLAVTAVSAFAYRADFDTYSIFTVGVFRRVERRVVTGGGYECMDSHCGENVELAERRKWYKEFVAAGMVVVRFDGGTHHYCEDHASFEVREDWEEPQRPRTQRLAASLVPALSYLFAEDMPETPEDSAFEDMSENVTAGVGDALSLIPVAFMIVILAALAGFAQTFRR